jgi:long-chain fatty acid transport protein
MNQTGQIPTPPLPALITDFAAKSTTPGSPLGNIGITQDLTEMGLPATFGIGFITTSGAGVDFRQVPASRGTNSEMAIFSIPVSFGIDLTERLSAGATLALGMAFFDGPFVGASGMTPDYALRGTLGANYRINECNNVGTYYQTRQSFNFDNAFLLNPGPAQQNFDINMDLPQNVGVGLANTALLDGQLLLGIDVLYKLWDNAALYDSVYDNQWVVQLGSQLTLGRVKLRAGYVWAENPIDQTPGLNNGGIVQEIRAVRYTQGLLAVTSQHRMSVGVGMTDVMPGIDMDLLAGFMFHDSEQLGPFTNTSIESYWIGAGLTWRFGG